MSNPIWCVGGDRGRVKSNRVIKIGLTLAANEIMTREIELLWKIPDLHIINHQMYSAEMLKLSHLLELPFFNINYTQPQLNTRTNLTFLWWQNPKKNYMDTVNILKV